MNIILYIVVVVVVIVAIDASSSSNLVRWVLFIILITRKNDRPTNQPARFEHHHTYSITVWFGVVIYSREQLIILWCKRRPPSTSSSLVAAPSSSSNQFPFVRSSRSSCADGMKPFTPTIECMWYTLRHERGASVRRFESFKTNACARKLQKCVYPGNLFRIQSKFIIPSRFCSGF